MSGVRLPIFMDALSTTPVDPRVLEVMLPCFTEDFGNAASKHHAFGWRAEKNGEEARAQIASLIGAHPREIVITSGATEAINLALKGVFEANSETRPHIITSEAEHKAVLDTCKRLEKRGARVSYLQPDDTGRMSVSRVEEALRDDTLLVVLMWANNEVGSLNPIRDLGMLCRERNVLFFTDAAQATGKVPIDVVADHVDLMSMSAHKLYGPKGIGALYVRRRPKVRLETQIDGGGHEHGLRSGTLNIPGLVGFGAACSLAESLMSEEAERLEALRDRLEEALLSALPDTQLNGSREHRLPNCLNLSFHGIDSDALVSTLRDVALSTGSACASSTIVPSHVLRSMGLSQARMDGAIRFGLSRFTSQAEVDYVINAVEKAVWSQRALQDSGIREYL